MNPWVLRGKGGVPGWHVPVRMSQVSTPLHSSPSSHGLEQRAASRFTNGVVIPVFGSVRASPVLVSAVLISCGVRRRPRIDAAADWSTATAPDT